MGFFANLLAPIKKALSGVINFQQNDPTTPNLAVSMEIPPLPNPCPPFGVDGFTGGDGVPGSIEHQAANVYCTIVLSLKHAQGILVSPIVRWPSLSKLIAQPRAGKMFNAYYDRYQLNFFYDVDPKLNKTIYTCESTDVVAHELGHAILDSLRPDLWAIQCVEIQAFHEAFGDINAILTGLTFSETVKHVLNETGGDLKHENVIARIAEEMGLAIWHARGNAGERPGCALRNAINDFQYTVPETLPTRVVDDSKLAGEPHNFSRVFTGAWYDALVNIYNAERQNKPAEDAIYSARDKLGRITFNGVRSAQVNPRFFGAVLKSMLEYDAHQGLGCGDFIRSAFLAHNITAPAGLTMSLMDNFYCDTPVQDALNLLGNGGMDTARIADFDDDKSDPLFECIVELPNTRQAGQFALESPLDFQAAVTAAKHSLKVLNEYNRVGVGPTTGKHHEKEFTVIDGRLIRNYYSCGCPSRI